MPCACQILHADGNPGKTREAAAPTSHRLIRSLCRDNTANPKVAPYSCHHSEAAMNAENSLSRRRLLQRLMLGVSLAPVAAGALRTALAATAAPLLATD